MARSLSALGNVISALADKSMGKKGAADMVLRRKYRARSYGSSRWYSVASLLPSSTNGAHTRVFQVEPTGHKLEIGVGIAKVLHVEIAAGWLSGQLAAFLLL